MKRLLYPIALFPLLAGCAVNPVTGDSNFVLMSEQEELTRGQRYDQEIRKKYAVLEENNLQNYVNHVGRKLAAVSHRPNLNFSFTVIDSPEVNAFALPGGYVFITRGMLAYLQSEAELAAVLGHEIGHVTARHAVRQHSGATAAGIGALMLAVVNPLAAAGLGVDKLGVALVRGYGRDHELESDRLGAQYMALAGYDPNAMIKVIGVLKNQEEFEKERAQTEKREPRIYHGVFATHPDNDQRLQEVVVEAARLHRKRPVPPKDDRYLLQIEGLHFGENPRNGIVRDRFFLRPDLNLTFTFPKGWQLLHDRDHLVALAPNRKGVIRLLIGKRPERATPAEHLRGRPEIPTLTSESAFDGPYGKGHRGIIDEKNWFGKPPTRAIAIYHGDYMLLFFGTPKESEDFGEVDAQTLTVAGSLRPPTPEEKALVLGRKLKIDVAVPGLTFAKLAARIPDVPYAESHLRLMNGKYPTGEPTVGDRFKLIEQPP